MFSRTGAASRPTWLTGPAGASTVLTGSGTTGWTVASSPRLRSNLVHSRAGWKSMTSVGCGAVIAVSLPMQSLCRLQSLYQCILWGILSGNSTSRAQASGGIS